MQNQMVNGVAQQVQVVYTQLFSAVPDQGPAPGVGSIGLGTIEGKVGVVKTKRETTPEPTMVGEGQIIAGSAMAQADTRQEKRSSESTGGRVVASAGSALALLVAIAVTIVF